MLLFIGRAVFLGWALCAGLWDLDHRRVPNWWMLPGYLIAGGFAAAAWNKGELGFEAGAVVAAVVFLSLLYWALRWWGGADAKFMIAAVVVFPNPGFLAAQAAGHALSAMAGRRFRGKSFPAVSVMTLSMFAYVLIAAAVSAWAG